MASNAQPFMQVPGLVVSTVLGCCECDFKCGSANKMCQHMFDTHHCLIQCPQCCVYLVPKAFHAGVMKLIDRHRREMYAHMPGHRMNAALTQQGGRSGETGNKASKLIAIECTAHTHEESGIHLVPYAKERFVLPGKPVDYGLQPTIKTDAGSMTIAAAHARSERSRQDPHAADQALRVNYFRCMSCLTALPTWTQVTKHIDATEHTFPHCIECDQCLKCYGPTRPWRHACLQSGGGFLGTYYTRKDYIIENQSQEKMYSAQNGFTGLSTTQYKCVCGLTFTDLICLAHHLRQVHGVTCIDHRARCRTCEVELPLEEMIQHMRQPIVNNNINTNTTNNNNNNVALTCIDPPASHGAGISGMTTHTRRTSSDMSLAAAQSNTAFSSPVSPPHTDEPAATEAARVDSADHRVVMSGFDGLSFLQYAPLLPPCQDQIGPYLDISGRPMSSPRYIILYQCPDCFKLYDAWECMTEHIAETGHCRAYCVDCGDYLPVMDSSHAALSAMRSSHGRHAMHSDALTSHHSPTHTTSFSNAVHPAWMCGGAADANVPPPPRNGSSRELPPPVWGAGARPDEESARSQLPGESSSRRVATMTRLDYLAHLKMHRNVIGFPASRETLERLVNQRDAEYTALIQSRRPIQTHSNANPNPAHHDPSQPNIAKRNPYNNRSTGGIAAAAASSASALAAAALDCHAGLAQPDSSSSSRDAVFVASWATPPRQREEDGLVFCYQCPGAPHRGSCWRVFRYYGDFVRHLMRAGHGPAAHALLQQQQQQQQQSNLLAERDEDQDDEEDHNNKENITNSILEMINKSEEERCDSEGSMLPGAAATTSKMSAVQEANKSTRSALRSSHRGQNAIKYDSLFPMIDYRVHFKASVLCKYFDFERCSYCGDAFPPKYTRLHEELCVEYHKSKRDRGAGAQR